MSQMFVLRKDDIGRASVLSNAQAFLARLPETKSWEVEIRQHRKKRSNPQNRYLFGVCYPILRDASGAATIDEIHDECCERFFGTVEVEVLGKRKTRPFRRTTTDENGEDSVMGTVDFGKFVEMVQRIGAELGVYIPEPDPMIPEHAR